MVTSYFPFKTLDQLPRNTEAMEYYSAVRKDAILPLATTWMDLETILPSEISQSEKAKKCVISLICRI